MARADARHVRPQYRYLVAFLGPATGLSVLAGPAEASQGTFWHSDRNHKTPFGRTGRARVARLQTWYRGDGVQAYEGVHRPHAPAKTPVGLVAHVDVDSTIHVLRGRVLLILVRACARADRSSAPAGRLTARACRGTPPPPLRNRPSLGMHVIAAAPAPLDKWHDGHPPSVNRVCVGRRRGGPRHGGAGRPAGDGGAAVAVVLYVRNVDASQRGATTTGCERKGHVKQQSKPPRPPPTMVAAARWVADRGRPGRSAATRWPWSRE